MACEADASGQGLDRAVDQLIAQIRVGAVLDVLDRAPAGSAAAASIAQKVLTPESVRALLVIQPIDFPLLDRLLARLGPEGADPLLDLLADSESRQVRRAILDRLVRVGVALGPRLLPRLADERWFVVRNVLFLAAEMPRPPAGLNAAAFRQHPDARVRREAYRLLFRDPADRTRSLCTALSDVEPGLQRLALATAAESGCPDPAVPLVVNIASNTDLDSDVRVGAIRVLASHGGPMALDVLLRLTEIRRRSFFNAMKGASASAEFLAALTGLGSFPADRRARERLEAAHRVRDAAVQKVTSDALRGMR
jgi:HEAT repeat protein